MKTLKRLAIVASALLLVLAAVLAFNTLRLEAEPLAKALPAVHVDAAAVKRLSEAVRIPTVSTEAAPTMALSVTCLTRSRPTPVEQCASRWLIGG